MHPITLEFPFAPVRPSRATRRVRQLFGLPETGFTHTLARDFHFDLQPGQIVLLTGPSGSGKSSLLRAMALEQPFIDVNALKLRDRPVIDLLRGPVVERLGRLSACGLAEARLALRSPRELSDGQRYRLRLACALDRAIRLNVPWVVADEFASNLDRTLAKVVAFNVGRVFRRHNIGLLAATTHDDLIADLDPDWHVHSEAEGAFQAERRRPIPSARRVSFADELHLETGRKSDWPAFARWHYRNRNAGFVRRVVLLKHCDRPIGICVFAPPAATLSLRSRFFGLRGRRSAAQLKWLNEHIWLLSRVVLHPSYRGAGIAADFIRRACESCPAPWIETLAVMGQANPVFERAGFVRVGQRSLRGKGAARYGGQYAAVGVTRRPETARMSEFGEGVYYVFDNRGKRGGLAGASENSFS